MSDYLIELLTGTKEQEDLIWRMVEVARKYSVKSELELNTIIRSGLHQLADNLGKTFREMKDKPLEERIAFAERSITNLVPLLGIEEVEAAANDAKKVYQTWLAEQQAKMG